MNAERTTIPGAIRELRFFHVVSGDCLTMEICEEAKFMYAKEKCRKGYPEKRTTDRNSLIPAKRYPGRVGADNDIRVRRKNTMQKNVAQRQVIRHKPKEKPVTEAEQEFDKTALEIDGILQTTYREFLKGDFKDASEAYLNQYLLKKRDYDEGNKNIYPAAAAGYVIESKVNERLGGVKHVMGTQVTWLIKGSRPDIVLAMDICYGFRKPGQAAPPAETVYAALDITTEQRWGHIFEKKGNWCNHKNIIYVAELTYPSIDFRTMGPITLTKEEQDRIDQILALKREIALMERRDCKESFLRFQEELVEVMKGGYPYKPMTTRQRETLIASFWALGLKLSFVAGSLTVTKIIGFEKECMLNWAIINTLEELKDTLVSHILQKRLIGIKVGIDLGKLHNRLLSPLDYQDHCFPQVPFLVDG